MIWMKRRLTVEQLNELTSEQKDHLREQWIPEKYDICLCGDLTGIVIIFHVESQEIGGVFDNYIWLSDEGEYTTKDNLLPLLDIGQMMELLAYKGIGVLKGKELNNNSYKGDMQNYICDALWRAVKAVI
jgi:hypothetical protein